MYVRRSSHLELSLLELMKMRASQINACAYCIDMHSKDARAAGETEQRLYALSAWRETPFFTDRERAALAWTEAVTLISDGHVRDEIYTEAREHFTEEELVNSDDGDRDHQRLESSGHCIPRCAGRIPTGGAQEGGGREAMKTISRKRWWIGVLCVVVTPVLAQDAKVTQLMTKDLAGITGKEGSMVTVEYPPGGSSSEHRHNAHTFVYVLEGSVVMQVKGGKEVTLGPGQTFYESPEDVHTISKNASSTKLGEIPGVLCKGKGALTTVPAK